MLLSRFWYLFLAVTAAAAIGAALLAQGIINRGTVQQVSNNLRRDRLDLEAVLRLEARSRLDRIAFITVDAKTGEILQKAREIEDPDKLWKLNGRLKQLLRGHIDRLAEAAGIARGGPEKMDRIAPAIAIAVDSRGRIIAQLGPLETNQPGTGLGTFPLIKRALQGYIRDDVWVYDRRVYRMAARPVIYAGEYVGAVVHGYRFDRQFAQTLSENLGGAAVAFFYGSDLLTSYTPADQAETLTEAQIAAPLQQVLKTPKFLKGERTDPVELQGGGLAVYSLATGSAAAVNVGYAVARPRKFITSPKEIFENATSDEVKALPFPLLVGTAVMLALLGLLFVFLERDRPLQLLSRKLSEIVQNERDRLIITEWRGALRKIADGINQAIDKQVEKAAEMAPASRKKLNLDEILGPTPAAQGPGAFFAFASDQQNASDGGGQVPEAPPPEPPAQPLAAPPAQPLAPQAQPADVKRGVPPPPRAGSSPGQSAPKPPPPPPHGPAPAEPAPAAGTEVSGPTLLAKETVDERDVEAFDEGTHFKEIFAQYMATRKECGESTEGLTYDKFLVTLRKNRDQIIAKHEAKAVRFTVYKKEGKAALKAAPIKKWTTVP